MNFIIWLYFFASICYLFLSFFFLSILEMKKGAKWIVVLILVLFTVSSFAGIAIHSSPNVDFCEFWFKGTYFISYFLPALILHFIFTLASRELSPRTSLLMYIPAFCLTVFDAMGITRVYDGFYIEAGLTKINYRSDSLIHLIYGPYLYLYFILCLYVLFDWEEKVKLFREKKTARILITLGIISFTTSGFFAIYFTSKGYFMGLLPVSLLIWFLGIWYAMLKYRFTDITSADASEAILEKVKDLILLVDQEGRIIRVNERVYEILGFSKEELIGQDFKMLIDDYEKSMPSLKRKSDRKSLNEEYVFDVNYRTRDGALIPVKIALSLVFDKLKDLIGIVIVGQDMRLTKLLQAEIDEKQKTAKELIESNEKLKELDKMKTDFLSMISHELRTPLTSILGFAKIMKKKFKNLRKNEVTVVEIKDSLGQMSENLGIIVEEGERLANLINDVLDIAKMEAGKIEWKFRGVSIKELIDRAFDVTSALVNEKGLSVEKDIEEDLPEINADFDRLLQVIINLISNCVKFTDEGSLKCVVRKDERNIKISIIDTGIGISQDDIEAVFEKFKQVGDTLTNRPKGTGLGLPICKQIIDHHGGKIWAESEIGVGSNFSFTLPLEKNFKNTKTVSIDNLLNLIHRCNLCGEEVTQSKSILVVDDDDSIAAFLTEILTEVGYKVERAANGMEAIEMISKNRPDLITLDIVMPEMSGFEVAAKIKGNPDTKDIPVVILSIIEDRAKGFLIGVDRYLTKPVDVEDLLKNIEYLLIKDSNEESVLIAVEDKEILKQLGDELIKKGYRKIYFANKEDFEDKVIEEKPKIIIVDSAYIHEEEIYIVRKIPGIEETSVFLLGKEHNHGQIKD